ncbi:YIP1 family protein [Methanolobus halotolerans]|uniref:YIP1 family protein n=2 Tax=Methanolobus halotolerans TaxID=2052935 RepID=A0A4E0Q6F6_9EURY|nr:YIP1 family protein [Methanolobus halotolerans]
MLEVLTDPNGFFKRKSEEDIEFKTPLIIVTILAIVGAISAFIISQSVIEALPPEASAFAGIGAAFGAIAAFIMTFIMWVIYSGIFYLISMVFNGEGSFKRVLEFVSYGFIPSIISSAISTYYTSRIYSNIDWSADPQVLQEALLSDPSLQIAGIIGILFLLWSANIWIFAIVHSRNLSVKDAAITVGIPILLYVLYNLYQLRIFGV